MRYVIGGITIVAALMLVRLWASRVPRDREFFDLDWEQYRQRKEKSK